jgi:hypothetical protein
MYYCGVFVCHFFDLLLIRKLESFKIEINIDEYRKTVLKKISENSKITRCGICKTDVKKSIIIGLFADSTVKYEKCPHLFHKKCLLE